MAKLFAFIITLGVLHIPTVLCSGIETMREDDSVLCTEHLDGSSNCESGVHPVSLLQTSMNMEQLPGGFLPGIAGTTTSRSEAFEFAQPGSTHHGAIFTYGPNHLAQHPEDCEELILTDSIRVCSPRNSLTYLVLCGAVCFIYCLFHGLYLTDCFGTFRKGWDVCAAGACIGLFLLVFTTMLNNPGPSEMFSWHPVLMTLAFPCLMTMGRWSYEVDPSWGADKDWTRRKIHAFCMGLALIAALGGWLAILMTNGYSPSAAWFHWHGWSMRRVHVINGYIVLFAMVFQAGVGICKAVKLIDGVESLTFHGHLGKAVMCGGSVQMLLGIVFWTGFGATMKVVLITLLCATAFFSIAPVAPGNPFHALAVLDSETTCMSEVAKHNSRQSAWIVVKGEVYDCTNFLDHHPGGSSILLSRAGCDATGDFDGFHSLDAWKILDRLRIGTLSSFDLWERQVSLGSAQAPDDLVTASLPDDDNVFLRSNQVLQMPLVKKTQISRDTVCFRFRLPSSRMQLGLPTGGHVLFWANIGGAGVARPYTPISDNATLGCVDFVVKVYSGGVHPKFPNGGKMSQHLDSLSIGDRIDCKGPFGDLVYKKGGTFSYTDIEHHCRFISFVAGGTGLTPCYQVISAILRDQEDPTIVCLLYANQSPDDILMRQELVCLAAAHPDRFQLWFTVDKVPANTNWMYSVGFIGEEMIRDRLFQPAVDTVTFLCGPPAMDQVCRTHLGSLGHAQSNVFSF